MFMQVYGVVMGWGQVLRSCTRVEAHLALVKFRPHSILHRGIKTQTWLLLWRIIDHTLILPSSPHERWDAEKASLCWSLYLCDQSSEMTEVSYLAAAFFFFQFCEKFSLLKIPVTKHAKRKSSHATEVIRHPNWKKGQVGWMYCVLLSVLLSRD